MTACALGVTSVQDTYDMDHELPNVIFALCSHLLELAGLIIIVSIYQPYFLAGAVRVLMQTVLAFNCTKPFGGVFSSPKGVTIA